MFDLATKIVINMDAHLIHKLFFSSWSDKLLCIVILSKFDFFIEKYFNDNRLETVMEQKNCVRNASNY